MSSALSQSPRAYRGRFAPSPTGPLHFGSLVSAVGSFLDARSQDGAWLLRIEDVDRPRTMAGAAEDILHTLEGLALYWDGPVLYQSARTEAYADAVEQLRVRGAIYPCACTRKEISDSALRGLEGQVYPGTCREGLPAGREARAWRIRTAGVQQDMADGTVDFTDRLQGKVSQHLESEIGDFVVLRADGLHAYQLAVVIDDAFQEITHVVRGADLLASTARQIYLQLLLKLPQPAYMHLPVVVNAQGEKLSKQTLAQPVDVNAAAQELVHALAFLRQLPPADLAGCRPDEILSWGVKHWNPEPLAGIEAGSL